MLPRNLSCQCRPGVAGEFRPDADVQVESAQRLYAEQQVLPANGLTATPYEFVIEPQENSFVSLANLTLHVKLQLLKESGDDLDEGAKVAPVNDVVASLWENIQVRINDHDFNPESGLYPAYKSVIAKMLSFNKAAAQQWLPGGFYPPDESVVAGGIDTVFTELQAKTAKSAVVSFSGPLPIDVCSLDNHLSPQTKLSISLYPSSKEFFLFAYGESGYTYKISELFMQFRRISLPSPMTEKILSQASRAPQRYLAPYTELKAIEVPTGLSSWIVPVYPSGHVLPKQLIVAQVYTTVPKMGKNPYIFKHFNLNYLAPAIDEVVPPNAQFEPNFDEELVSRDYYRLFTETGKQNAVSQANLVTYESFANGGHTFFPMDLSPDKCNGAHLHAGNTGKLDLYMRWSVPLTGSITVLVYALFDQIITIDPQTGVPRSHIF